MNTTTWNKSGHMIYKNHIAMQNPFAFEVFKNFFKYNKFDTIIEIGTAGGGWSIFLNENAKSMGGKFVTYDIKDTICKYDEFSGIDFRIKDVFSYSNEIGDIITNSNRVALFCDGGNKIHEYNTFSSFLKPGDFILAHDYAPTQDYHIKHIYDKYWNWCEIQDSQIEQAMISKNIIKYLPDMFIPTAWICTLKIQ